MAYVSRMYEIFVRTAALQLLLALPMIHGLDALLFFRICIPLHVTTTTDKELIHVMDVLCLVGVTLNHLDAMCGGPVEGGDRRFDSCVGPTLPISTEERARITM